MSAQYKARISSAPLNVWFFGLQNICSNFVSVVFMVFVITVVNSNKKFWGRNSEYYWCLVKFTHALCSFKVVSSNILYFSVIFCWFFLLLFLYNNVVVPVLSPVFWYVVFELVIPFHVAGCCVVCWLGRQVGWEAVTVKNCYGGNCILKLTLLEIFFHFLLFDLFLVNFYLKGLFGYFQVVVVVAVVV